VQKFEIEIIGTHLILSIDTPHSCDEVFSHIQAYLESFEKKYSRFIEWNWLHVLNTSRRWVLGIDGKNMLSYILDLATKTDGYFDPTVGKRLTELGYGLQWKVKSEKWITPKKWNGNYKDIEIVGDEIILHWDILLEFGGLGKGYLIDGIKNFLEIYPRFLINFWWDLYGRGGWKVGLESPFASDEIIGTHMLDDGFLACSAWTRRKWGNHHHLINPKTGESATEVIASYVEWLSWMVADAYATTLCVMPWELARETLEKTPEISGVIVKYDGTIFQKEGSKSEVFS
jgi:FAD:protein FMN transferase